jgi:spermidine/putrescine transport system substrate-binding protein
LLSRPELEKKVSLLDDSREVIGIALKVLGQSFNTVDPNALQNAKKWLFSVRNRIKMFTSEPVMALANGEFFASHVYSSDAMYMKYRLKKNIEYFFPEEGFVWSIDCLVIPQNAQHKEEAYVLIDYLLGLTMSVHLTQTVFLSPVNLNVVDYITPEIKSEPAIFPSPGVMSKAELIRDTQSATVLYDRIWTEVKSKTD